MKTVRGARRMPSPRLALQATAAATLAMLAGAPAASAVFTPTADLSGGLAADPQVATDADFDSVVVWDRLSFSNGPQFRTISATGTLGSVTDLTTASAGTSDHFPRVAMDSQGDALFAWVHQASGSSSTVRASMLRNGTLGGPFQLFSNNINQPSAIDIASDANGDSVVTFVRENRVQAVNVGARGELGPVRNLSAGGARAPQVAIDAGGDAVITWVLEDAGDGDNDQVQARTMSVNGTLQPILPLSAASGRATAPQLATDADGDTTFTWLRTDGVRDRVQTRRFTAAGTLGATQTLSGTGRSAQAPQVATDVDGDSVFAWEVFDGIDDLIQARTLSSAGTLGSVTNMSASGGEAFRPQIDTSDAGATSVAWLRFSGTNDVVQVRRILPNGNASGTSTLSAAGADAETPQVAVSSETSGTVVVWERNGIIQGSLGP